MHLSRLPSGHWRVAVKHHGRRRTATARTKGEATQLGAELLLELGATPRAATVTVTELLATWLAASELSITFRADAVRVIDRLPAEFTARRLSNVTPAVIEALYRQLKREGWSPHRIGRAHTALSSSWSLALRYEWAAVNPFQAAKAPAVPAVKVQPPDQSQVATLLAAADERLVLYLLVSATIGARRGEVVALQWPDIADTAIVVRRSLAYAPGQGVQVTEGKTGPKGHRVVAIDDELAAALRAHRVEQVAMALAAGLPAPVWLFSHDAGVHPWRPDFATREFARLRAKTGVDPSVKMRDLRHYVATQLLAAGVPLKTVGDRLGHRQLSTTSDVYGAYVPAADQAAAEIMGALRTKRSAQ